MRIPTAIQNETVYSSLRKKKKLGFESTAVVRSRDPKNVVNEVTFTFSR